MTSEEVSKALNITLRALQYYRQIGIVPYTSLGNKVFSVNGTSLIFCNTI